MAADDGRISPDELRRAADALPSDHQPAAPRVAPVQVRRSVDEVARSSPRVRAITWAGVEDAPPDIAIAEGSTWDDSTRAAFLVPTRNGQPSWWLAAGIAGGLAAATAMAVMKFGEVPIRAIARSFALIGFVAGWAALTAIVVLCWTKHLVACAQVPLRGGADPDAPSGAELMKPWSVVWLIGYLLLIPLPYHVAARIGGVVVPVGAVGTAMLAALWPLAVFRAAILDAAVVAFWLRSNGRIAWAWREQYGVVAGAAAASFGAALALGLVVVMPLPPLPWVFPVAAATAAAGLTYAHGIVGALMGRMIRRCPAMLPALLADAAVARELSR